MYLFSKIPRLDYRHCMVIFTVLGIVLLQFNDVTIEYCIKLGEWFESHEFYFFYYLTTKLDNGAFAILQYIPFAGSRRVRPALQPHQRLQAVLDLLLRFCR